ncbi:hypothetical protein CTheo_8889 [Ceratobasidium theobromae]|uniref:Uncharacterized protein n=1 Tax=Ceratobasidium theobromae TaxID=1582974 RepID=A0A5N5Q8B4_9AGAM|nr:hypothetical protein CTheo_8889 [Ceratobasidium theobromae]
MAKTEATTRLANDPDFLNHVIEKLTEGSRTQRAVKTGFTDDQDARKIAEDALAVYKSFQDPLDELRVVDKENPGEKWGDQWAQQCTWYRQNLARAQDIARMGAQYIDDFNKFTPDILGATKEVIIKRLKDWFENHQIDQIIELATEEMSQELLEVSTQVTDIYNAFSRFAIQKGGEYDDDQEQLQRQIKDLQNKIAGEQAEAAKAQSVLNEILAGLTMVVNIFDTIFGFGQGNTLMQEALELLRQHTQAAQGKYLESNPEYFRVGQFANLWAAVRTSCFLMNPILKLANWYQAHSDFLEFEYWVKNDYDDDLDILLRKKVEALKSAGAVFSADMERFRNVIEGLYT